MYFIKNTRQLIDLSFISIAGSHGKQFLVLFMKNLGSIGNETAYVLTDKYASLNIASSSQLQSTIKSTVDENYDVNSAINIYFPNSLTCDYFTKESKAVLLTTTTLSTVVMFDSDDIYTTDVRLSFQHVNFQQHT